MLRKNLPVICAIVLCIVSCPVVAELAKPRGHPERDIEGLLSEDMAQDIVLDYDTRREAAIAHDALEVVVRDKPDVAKLTIKGYGSLVNWTLLEEAIKVARSLDSLHWTNNALIPSKILAALETHQSDCKLFYTIPFSNWDRYDEDVPFAQPIGWEHDHEHRAVQRSHIFYSTNLYALRAAIEYGDLPNMEDMALVQRILETCPNLRELDLSVSWGGCLAGSPQSYSFDFTKPERHFPSLSAIKLDGYRLLEKADSNWWLEYVETYPIESRFKWPWNKVPKSVLSFIGIDNWIWLGAIRGDYLQREVSPESPTNLDVWLERMDWSNLNKLELNSLDSEVMQKLTPVLGNLTSISIRHGWIDAGLELLQFLRTTERPLEAISFQRVAFEGFDELISAIASKHGTKLKLLSLYNLPRCFTGYLNAGHVTQLRENCPILEEVVVNSERLFKPQRTPHWEFDHDFIDGLALLPDLRNLRLRFESWSNAHGMVEMSGDSEGDNESYQTLGLTDPLVNQTSIEGLVERVRNIRKHFKLGDLELLDIVVGNWEGRHASYMGGPPKDLLGKWECTANGCVGGNMWPSYHGADQSLAEPHGERVWFG